MGAVLMEVKSAVKKRAEAVSQLDRMHKLVNILFKASLPAGAAALPDDLPVCKVVCIPGGKTTKTIQEGIQLGVWHLYESKISQFKTSWADVCADLASHVPSQQIVDGFAGFSNLIAGLWSMKSFKGVLSYKGRIACS